MAEFTAGGEAPKLADEGLDRGVGFWGLLWSSETSIIGSGWLFGALGAATIAGPSAIIGWLVAGIIIAGLALIHAELGGLFPVTGGTSRFPHYAFGSFAGATFGWASYLQAASVAPIEVLAAIQYLSTAHWARHWYNATGNTLHGWGILAAVVLTFFFAALNVVGIRWLAKVSNAITVWKVVIPVITVIILLLGHFHSSNFHGFFVPGGVGISIKSILSTLPAGLVFSLLGFEQAVQIAGEAAHPERDVAKAVIISLIVGVVLYVLVQIAFIGAIQPSFLKASGGWLNIANAKDAASLNAGPFWTLASMAGIAWLATVLRIDAVISPSGTALIYQTSSARLSFGMSKNGFVPELFEGLGANKVPVFGVIVAAVVGLIFLLPFPSWSKLVGVVTSASVLMYAAAPLALGALRLQKPDLPRPYKVPAAWLIAPLSFIGATWVIVFSGWGTYTTLMLTMFIGYFLIWLSYKFKLNSKAPKMDWIAAPWIARYFIGMLIIEFFSGFQAPSGIIGGVGIFKHVFVGGHDRLGVAGSLVISALFALDVYYGAIKARLPVKDVDEYIEDVYPSSLGGE